MSRKTTARHPAKRALNRVANFARAQLISAIDEMLSHFSQSEFSSNSKAIVQTKEFRSLKTEHERLCGIAELLMEWHSNDAFLTSEGAPRPLPLSGNPSLHALARRVLRSESKSRQLVSDLVAFDLVTRNDKMYVPAQRSAVLGSANPLNLAYATIAATRLLQTISHNISNQLPRLYERQVSDTTIRARDLPVYLRFVEQQAQYLIDSTDDWLARRRISTRPGKNAIRVGIGAYAWADLGKEHALATGARRRAK